MRALPSSLAVLLSLTVTAAVVSPGRLARAAAPALATSLTGDARADYESGKLMLAAHDYAQAASKFRAAYDASHDPRLLWNMALCEKELQHFARASTLVGRFVREASALLTPEQLAQAQTTQTQLAQHFSFVSVSVQPAGALVTVDGEDVGRSPIAAPVPVDLGQHVVRIQREGYQPQEQPLEVDGPRVPDIVVSLVRVAEPTRASLEVHPSDAAATVAVDDTVVARGVWEGTMEAGPHRVVVTAEGKRPFHRDITLAPGEHRSVDVHLEAKAIVWPWFVGGGAVVVAGAVIGGYFLFRPSDTTGSFPMTDLGSARLASPRSGRR